MGHIYGTVQWPRFRNPNFNSLNINVNRFSSLIYVLRFIGPIDVISRGENPFHWSTMVVHHGSTVGDTEWWSSVVVQRGGSAWWSTVAVVSGGPAWW